MKFPAKYIWMNMLTAIILLVPCQIHAQHSDTNDVYHRLQRRAEKHKVTKWIYEGIFRDPIIVNDTFPAISDAKKENVFLPYQDKVIRDVRIVSVDPFGYSVNDTLMQRPNRIENLGNRYHLNTRRYIIRNVLLFKPNDKLDPLEISESERLLRQYPYINDARIYVSSSENDSGMVDITVMVQDKWSTIAESDLDVTRPDIKIVERNIFGLGHQLEEGITWANTEQRIQTFGRYTIFNVGNTFINSSAFYSLEEDNRQWGVSFDRPFYSALAKWAGGASFTRNLTALKVIRNENTAEEVVLSYPVNHKTEDFWIAKNFPVTEKKTASINRRSYNYMTGLRYYHVEYAERPSFLIDSNRLNRDQTMILNNIGFSKRKYYKDRYLFRFGANEDIPEGYSIEYIHGILNKELSSLWYYSGIKLAAGRHYDHLGYLSAGIGYGTFYNKTFKGSGVVNADLYYFSDLMAGGRWFFRQFTRLQYIQGIDREPYEAVNINGKQMYGFSSDILSGKSKMVLNLEFVMYAPYQFIGFKFAPVLLCGLAKNADNISNLATGYTYQAYALGLLIRNEHLIASTFEVSIGLYPYIPGSGDYILKLDPIGSYNVKARDYIIAKPDLVSYQ